MTKFITENKLNCCNKKTQHIKICLISYRIGFNSIFPRQVFMDLQHICHRAQGKYKHITIFNKACIIKFNVLFDSFKIDVRLCVPPNSNTHFFPNKTIHVHSSVTTILFQYGSIAETLQIVNYHIGPLFVSVNLPQKKLLFPEPFLPTKNKELHIKLHCYNFHELSILTKSFFFEIETNVWKNQ